MGILAPPVVCLNESENPQSAEQQSRSLAVSTKNRAVTYSQFQWLEVGSAPLRKMAYVMHRV